MTREQAKAILLLYRPDSEDAGDAQFAEALGLARRDAELGQWFAQHCALYTALRREFRTISVPAGLKSSILAAHEEREAIVWWRRPVFAGALAAAAAIVLLVSVMTLWPTRPREGKDFSAYRARMVKTVLREYRMDLVTTNDTQIRQFLTRNQAHGDYALPAGLDRMQRTGSGVLSWRGRRVGMVCFGEAARTNWFLFIIDRSALPDAPAVGAPRLLKVNKLATASWTSGDKTYVLAGPGDEEVVRGFL